MDRHTLSAIANSQSCIRCERDGSTATRYIGRFRLVRDFTLCINCFNRQREVERGANSKGAKPVKWAHLQQATITIENAAGEWRTLDIGLRTGRAECERYVARIHPGCVIVECFMSGTVMQPAEKPKTFNDIAREAGVNPGTARSRAKKNSGSIETPAPRKPRPDTIAYAARQAGVSHQTASYRLKKYGSIEAPNKAPTVDAPAASPAWHQVFGDPSEAAKQRKPRPQPLPALSREEDAAYRQSFEETVSDYGFGSDLADFVEWIAKDWPAFAHKPAELFVAVPAPVAHVDVAKPVSEPSIKRVPGTQVFDVAGQRFGMLTAVSYEGKDRTGKALWRFLCDCGSERTLRASSVKNNRSYSRGCFRDSGVNQRCGGNPAELLEPIADAVALPEAVEPVLSASESVADAVETEQGEWDGCFIETDGVRVYVTAYAAEHGISDWDAAIELGFCERDGDEPDEQPAPEPIAQPAFIERTRKLTKAEKKALKKAERAERLAQAQPKRPSNPKQIAVTARAYIEVMYAMGGAKR
ncbi:MULTISPECIES: hypothetical protein [unclassified Caballeronia]|uniref:hypothetical protein n=1 Tax=unclassified Caballeronia TaxID=2646786 RepID=UPI0013EC113A|nr:MULTISPECIES: hypothetical protein [unclassified Caballeronia]